MPDFTFPRKPVKFSNNRLILTIPQEIVQFINPQQTYEITMTPIGTIQVFRR